MATLTIDVTTWDSIKRVQPGDRITHIDGRPLPKPPVAAAAPSLVHQGGPWQIRLEHDSPAGVERYFYPDTQAVENITVERPEPEPVPAPAPPLLFLHERERKTLRRNRHYEDTLRLLDDGKGGAVDLRTRVEIVNRYNTPRSHSHTAGTLAAFYGWTERVADYTWRLTPAGRRVLAVLDQRKKG